MNESDGECDEGDDRAEVMEDENEGDVRNCYDERNSHGRQQ